MTLSLPGASVSLLMCAALFVPVARADHDRGQSGSILNQLPSSSERIVSTVPQTGDQNPYGVAFVPEFFHEGGGPLEPGDILVSNFNNNQNTQGTGSTIMRVSNGGQVSVFFQGATTGLGLTTALGVLGSGFVLVGNVPTMNGAVEPPGSLLVIDRTGKQVADLTDASLLAGPWDLTINDFGFFAQIFVSNVLSGTVTRLDVIAGETLHVVGKTQIASGYLHRTDPNALVVGPTGLAYDHAHDILYVASTGDNAIFAVPQAGRAKTDGGMGKLVYQDNTHLHGPLGLTFAPNGNLITANGDAVNAGGTQNALVEFTPQGAFVAQFQIDSGTAGAAFGLAFGSGRGRFVFAAVDDDQNTLDIWTVHGGDEF